MRAKLLSILLSGSFFFLHAQDAGRIRIYEQRIQQAKTDEEKVLALGELAEYYSVFKLESAADSILQTALGIAEMSTDRELVLKVLFNNNISNLNAWSNKHSYERSIQFIEKGLDYAQDLGKQDYIALAHLRMAAIFRKRLQFDEAQKQATAALTALSNSNTDSLKCAAYIEIGDISLAESDAVTAFGNYNAAIDMAYKLKNIQLQSAIYNKYSNLHRIFGDTLSAKKYLLENLEANRLARYTEGQFHNYINLAKITNERQYLDSAGILAEKLHSDRFKISAKLLLFYWYMVEKKDSSQTIRFLSGNPELNQYINNTGPGIYDWEMGNIYRYAGGYKSALACYERASKLLYPNNEPGIHLEISRAMAEAYLLNKDSATAQQYYEKAFNLCKQVNNLAYFPDICKKLGSLNSKRADYRAAYYYAMQADSAGILLVENNARDKMAILKIEQENKKHENDLRLAKQNKERNYNLQILAITLMLTSIFAFMLLLGMFAVSKTTIRMMGYFAFISLFEFIILVLENPIEEITHGAPIWKWAIKIGLIALLVPCQHFLEHHLIRFLQSRKLLEARQNFSPKNWWKRLKNPAPKVDAGAEDDLEEDTAVL